MRVKLNCYNIGDHKSMDAYLWFKCDLDYRMYIVIAVHNNLQYISIHKENNFMVSLYENHL